MILTSLKDMDMGFVAKAISEHSLDPNPEAGFHAEADYWQETARWKRVVERYKWGAVIFLADRERRTNATIVAIGKLDIPQGRVSQQGGWQDIAPSWYKEMAMELAKLAKPSAAKLQVPPCLGFRVADVVCDGGKNEHGKMEPACAWRERCMAVQTFAQANNRLQEDLLRGKSPEQIIQMTTRLLTNSGVGQIVVALARTDAKANSSTAPLKAPKVALAPKQTSVPKSTPATDPAQSQAVLGIVASVMTEVAEASGVNVSADKTKHLAAAGDLYMVDRTENSDYVSIYQARKPKPLALASFRVRARVGLLVQLPIAKSDPLLKPILADDVRDWKDGAFQSAIREVPLEGGVRLEHIKHIIVAILQQASA